jgi:transcriptional regulator of acetoin/glycerol metabolism
MIAMDRAGCRVEVADTPKRRYRLRSTPRELRLRRDRALWLLHHVHGYTVEGAAESLGIERKYAHRRIGQYDLHFGDTERAQLAHRLRRLRGRDQGPDA